MQIIKETPYNYKSFNFKIRELSDGLNTIYEVFDDKNQPIIFKGKNNDGKEEKWKLSATFPWKVRTEMIFNGYDYNPEYFEGLIMENLKSRVENGIDEGFIKFPPNL